MKKRRLDLDAPLRSQLQHILQSLPKLDVSTARQVVQLLHADQKQSGSGTGHNRRDVFPEGVASLVQVSLSPEHPKRHMWMLSFPQALQRKINSCALFADMFAQALKATRNKMELTLFWDEAVPGNPLSPDLSRKSGLTYGTFPDFPITFLETSWLTLACCRTEDMQKVPEGYCKAMTCLLERLHADVKDGFMIEVHGSPHLVFLRRISFLGDADAIRVCTGCKGASGLKCCLHCTNVISGKHISLPGHEHISSAHVERFQASSMDALRDMVRHLQDLPTKTSREKAETALGWNLAAVTASFLFNENLQSVITLEDVLFDPMHVFVANGIVNQELGLWYSRLLEKSRFELEQFQRYVQHGWNACERFEIHTQGLLKTKLWQMGRDYRGDASQTLSVLPLAVAFSEEVLQAVCPQLSAEIQCLQGLYKVILAWLKAKRCRDASEEVVLKFAESQGQHLRLFVATYGWESVRPKMHYSLHLPAQIRRKGFVLDAFATERKHRYFKNTVANSVRRLHDFASVAMLKLTEYDMNTALPAEKMRTRLVGRVSDMDILAPVLSAGKAVVSHSLEHGAQTFGANQYFLLNANQAVAVQAAVCADGAFYLLCHELIKRKESVGGLSHWNQTSDDFTCVPLLDLASMPEALYHRSEPSKDGKHVSLLLG